MSEPQSKNHELNVEPLESMTQEKSVHSDEQQDKKDDEIAIHDENEEEGSKND